MRQPIANPELEETIRFLKVKAKESKARIWKVAAEYLSRPSRSRAVLNLSRIAREADPDTLVLVPGKVLGAGLIDRPVTVGAFQFSKSAKAKIEQAGGKCLHIKDFAALHPKGSKVQILG